MKTTNSSQPPEGTGGRQGERAVAIKTIPATTVPPARGRKWRPFDVKRSRQTHGLVCIPLTHTDPIPDVVEKIRWSYRQQVGGCPGGVWKLGDVRQWLRYWMFGLREAAEVQRLMPLVDETIAEILNNPKNGVRVVELA